VASWATENQAGATADDGGSALQDRHRVILGETFRCYQTKRRHGAVISAEELGRRVCKSGRRVEDLRRELLAWGCLLKVDHGPGKVAEWLIDLPPSARPLTRTLTADEAAALARQLADHIRRQTPTGPEVALRAGSVLDGARAFPVTNPGISVGVPHDEAAAVHGRSVRDGAG